MEISRSIFRVLSKALSVRHIYLTKSLSYRNQRQVLPPNFDYIRHATLGLCFEEIESKKVKGSVAELGVYQGNFSQRLNQLFSDRSLYLFDTFKGFDKDQVLTENKRSFSKGEQDFSNTSEDLVLGRMPFPEKCIICRGTFPRTAAGIHDTFCFVSIDADLFEPTYEGLLFFYPRLEKGGYIFIHDYNNDQYKGSKEAVRQFCREHQVAYVPVPDGGGSVVISK